MTPLEALKRAISRWEGGFQAQATDPGNYVTMPDGSRKLIGTMRGVTPTVLAAHRGIAAHELTRDVMLTLTLDEAAEIGLTRFYKGTGLDLLAWGPATEALVDFAWGSGPGQAAKSLQRLLGVVADGTIGPITVDAYARWVAEQGWETAARAVRDMRVAFYDLIIQRNPVLRVYRQGWHNRANWMTPEIAEWWAPWAAAPAPLPAAADRYAGTLPKPVEPAPVLVSEAPKPVTRSRNFWIAVTQWFTGATTVAGGVSLTDLSTQIGPATAVVAFVKANLWILLLVGGIAMVVSLLHVLVKLSEERAKREAM